MDWKQVVEEQTPRIRRIAARRVPQSMVDDVVQETFLRAYRSRQSLDASRPMGPWLATIASHVAKDATRRAAAVGNTFPQEVVAPDAATDYASAENVAVIRQALQSLSSRHRHLLELVALDGVRQVTIAEHEGVAPEVVRSAVLRARQRFRVVHDRLMQEHGLLGVAGSVKPMIVRVRHRLGLAEALLPRKAEVGAALLSLLAAAASSPGRAAAVTPIQHDRATETWAPVGSDLASLSASPVLLPDGLDAAISTRAPGGGISGRLSADTSLDADTYWSLTIDPTGLTLALGTSGSSGTVAVQMSAAGGATRGGASAEATCAPDSKTASVLCAGLERAEDALTRHR